MEKWLDIPGFEKLYQASNYGNIRTCEGKITSNALYPKRIWKQRVLKQKYSTSKYGRKDAHVTLWKDGKPHDFLVARLIAMAWCNGHSDGMTVNHIDGNTLNNKADNLEWVSLKINIQKAFESGLYSTSKPVMITVNGTNLKFNSMASASRFIGKNDKYISARISKGKPLVFGTRSTL